MQCPCPVCESQVLESAQSAGVTINSCRQCAGMWLDARTLNAVVGPASHSLFTTDTRNGPGRCRANHPIPRAMATCPVCDGAPIKCPSCDTRLSLRSTSGCAVDVCSNCHGVWFDAGELQTLKTRRKSETEARTAPSSTKKGWEIPPAANVSAVDDPWRAPGQVEPLDRTSSADRNRPFLCRLCGVTLSAYDAWALNGDIYCSSCRLPGSVSSKDLPPDLSEPYVRKVAQSGDSSHWGEYLREILSLLSTFNRG
jgi:Zn-finger nucleic acid-binding protein